MEEEMMLLWVRFIGCVCTVAFFLRALWKDGFSGVALFYLILFSLMGLSTFGQILVQA